MKKILLVLLLGVILTVSGVFADHPGGWGIGLMGNGGWGYGRGTLGGGAITLKAPMLPIYWGISGDFGYGYMGIGLSGDYYLIDNNLADFDVTHLGWYLGLGGYFGFTTYDSGVYYSGSKKYGWSSLSLGARLPIGLSFQIPVSNLGIEFFAALIPNIGIGMYFWDKEFDDYWGSRRDKFGLIGGIGGEAGFRLWF